MPEAAAIFVCLACCALAAVLLQRAALWLRKQPMGGKLLRGMHLGPVLQTRPERLAGEAVAACIGMQAACLFLLLTARPGMSFLLVAAVLVLLVVINHAKERILREPLVLADAWLLKQIFRYPEMYFPFLPMKGIALGLGGLALVLLGLTRLEPAMPALRTPLAALILAAAFLLPILGIWFMRKSRLCALSSLLLALCPVGNDAAKDAQRNGPLCSAMLHPVLAGLWEREGRDFLQNFAARPASAHWPPRFEAMLSDIAQEPAGHKPHVVIVQAESFSDIRPLLPEKSRECFKQSLPNWEGLLAKQQVLPTPDTAFGAYTMRTEFSVLTGLSAKELGPFSFNPYLLSGRQKLWSLARFFKEQGYTTLCLHPYHKDFFRRDRVMENLGFDRFWGLEDLADLPTFGPHTSDLALAKHLRGIIEASPQPVFAFVITMEAHGPWNEGRLTKEEVEASLGRCDNDAFAADTRMYLCHLLRMDKMLGILQSATSGQSGNTLLWAYGDHDPALQLTRAQPVQNAPRP